MLFPLFVFTILSIFLIFKRVNELSLKIFLGLSISIFLFQPNVFKALFDILSCKNLSPEPGKSYISSNLTTECFTPYYFSWVGAMVIPAFLFYALIFPLVVWKYTKNNLSNIRKVKLFITDYGRNHFYWYKSKKQFFFYYF